MMIDMLPIKDLTLLDNNPRKISKDQMEKLCKSITDDPDFLNHRPILVNKVDDKYVVYAGNQRVRAAKKLGWEKIPASVELNVPEDVIKARIIKDNKTYGEFDFDILANEFDIDVLILAGFQPHELDIDLFSSDVEEIDEKEEKPEKVKNCPHCNGIL